MSETLTVDDLEFRLVRSPRRRTVGVTVERDGSLLLSAPTECPLPRIADIAREKQFWVYSKLAAKELLFRPAQPKEFVSGESFHYLGRSYRLKIVPNAEHSSPLRLSGGRFLLRRDAVAEAQRHFVRWYSTHGFEWLKRRVALLGRQVGVRPASFSVRDLGYRWGSCSPSGDLFFHWRTVLLPPRIIEYVIAHELVHMLVPNHSTDFWARLKQALPDSDQRRDWLREEGARYV